MSWSIKSLLGRLSGTWLVCAAISGCAAAPLPVSRYAFQLESRPAESLDNVHIIFVESNADIGHAGRIEEVCCELRDMGLRNAVYFEPFVDGGSCDLAEHIRGVRSENPAARIMLVGWSIGTLCVKNTLIELDAHCESVDTIVYIDSTTIILSDFTGHPENYDRAVLIYRRGYPMPSLPRSVSRCIDEVFHLPVGHNERTIDQLVLEATRLADGQ
ncbi:MAG: hypothetical protein NT013_26305 [Planctomycetia bacterium]|nr:hypothetical protein [Planctomycetia bacterium]